MSGFFDDTLDAIRSFLGLKPDPLSVKPPPLKPMTQKEVETLLWELSRAEARRQIQLNERTPVLDTLPLPQGESKRLEEQAEAEGRTFRPITKAQNLPKGTVIP